MAGLQLALKLNRLADAEAHLQAAIRLDPTNRSHQMNLAVLHLQSRDAEVAEAARRELAAFQADPAFGLPVLRSLITDAVLRAKLAEAKELSLRLLAQTNALFEDRLQHLTVLEKAKDPELAGWLTRVREEASTNARWVGQVATWLNGNARPKETVAWVDTLPDTIRTNPAIAMIEADALAQLADWPGLETRLTEQNWADADFLRLAMLSRAFREQGRRDSAEANWRRATAAAEARVGMQTVLVQLAASWNWRPERDGLLWAIVRRSPQEEWAWQSLLRSANQAGDTPSVYRVYTGLLERNPDSAELKNNVAFVGLLLNRDVEQATQLARAAYEKNGTNASIVSTLAFALHRQGRTGEGLQLFQPLPEAERQKPEIALYYAVLLNAAGQREKAATYAALAEKGPMLPEERRLLDAVKAK
jgi:Flp pilus assembly protein TadD